MTRMKSRNSVKASSVVMPPVIKYRYRAIRSGKIMTVRRMKMREWLTRELDRKDCPGLHWKERENQIFTVSWRHASSNRFDGPEDGTVFLRWAEHTGNVSAQTTHSTLKSNFRCALRSLPDCVELTEKGDKKGEHAKRTFQFISKNNPKYIKKEKGKAKTVKTARPVRSSVVTAALPNYRTDYQRNVEYSSDSNSSNSSSHAIDQLVSTSPGPHTYVVSVHNGASQSGGAYSSAPTCPEPTQSTIPILTDLLGPGSPPCFIQGPCATPVEMPPDGPRPVSGHQVEKFEMMSLNMQAGGLAALHPHPGPAPSDTKSEVPNWQELGIGDELLHQNLYSGGSVRVRQPEQYIPEQVYQQLEIGNLDFLEEIYADISQTGQVQQDESSEMFKLSDEGGQEAPKFLFVSETDFVVCGTQEISASSFAGDASHSLLQPHIPTDASNPSVTVEPARSLTPSINDYDTRDLFTEGNC